MVPTFQSLGDAVADKLREANFSDIVSDGYSYFTFKNANRLALLRLDAKNRTVTVLFGWPNRDGDVRDYVLDMASVDGIVRDVTRWLNGLPLLPNAEFPNG